MRIFILCCCMFFVVQYTCGQSANIYTASILSPKPSLHITPPGRAEYDLHLADKKLKTARRCIIAGSVLTGAGVIMMIGGAAYALAPRPVPVSQPGQFQGKESNFTSPIIWISSIPLLAPGITVLGIGLAQHKKWKHIKTDASVETGIFSNGQIGIAMNF